MKRFSSSCILLFILLTMVFVASAAVFADPPGYVTNGNFSSYTIEPIRWNSAHPGQNISHAVSDRRCPWVFGGISEKGQTFRCYADLAPARPS
jgi:hypothetical protein